MAQHTFTHAEPRKSPVQARSAASVDAILDATIQVLLRVGPEKLTTTRVAARAGVSVGTLYQYFPNKLALLLAALRLHMEEIFTEVETMCLAQRGQPVELMAESLAVAFLAVKMRHPEKSQAMYAVSTGIEGARVAAGAVARVNNAIVAMLQTAPEELAADLRLMAAVLQGVIAGIKRQLLESDFPETQFPVLQRELIVVVRGYARACIAVSRSEV